MSSQFFFTKSCESQGGEQLEGLLTDINFVHEVGDSPTTTISRTSYTVAFSVSRSTNC